jgi:general secretion pathway protein C
MNFALNELHVTILNLLLVGLIAIFLGLSLEDAYRFHVAGAVVPAASESSRTLTVPRHFIQRPRVFYNAITDRDIFNLAPPPVATSDEKIDIQLLGTSLVTSGKPFVIVQDQSGRQSLYQKGDEIPGVGRLLQIEANRAIILHNGHRVAVEIPPDLGLPPMDAPMPRPFYRGLKQPMPLGQNRPSAPGIRRLAPDRYVLARATVNADLQNPAPLFTQIRAIPNVQNGSANGFRLSEIEPGSVFQQIGLQDGDLLTNVSGQPVGDPIKAISMLATLRDQSSITLNVIRDGSPLMIHYSIR